MKFRSFQNNFHDGHLVSFELGPRREVTLEIALDPVWNKQAPPSVSVRLSGIDNFDEVSLFLRSLPPPPRPDAYRPEVVGLQYLKEGPNWVILDLAALGHVRIQCRHVTET